MQSDGKLDTVAGHYGVGGILSSIQAALAAAGKSLETLTPADLAPVDAFHIRGREATLELAGRAGLGPGQRVLDVGCGLGGSARHLASEYGCRVDGLDLTDEYIQVARALARLVQLEDHVSFHTGSALELPFEDGSFDVVWTEHAQMNIADKESFYRQIRRVLKPGGRLAFHDIFQGDGGDIHLPAPWASQAAISHLRTPQVVRELLDELGLRVLSWEDKTSASADWFRDTLARLKSEERPPLGLHLLMGETGPEKFRNVARNLDEGRIAVIQAIVEKPG
jgi:ubiquinone/menaquinone biosynthesis C-methylase UbiE